jgi:lysophospholipase L1-like esterase
MVYSMNDLTADTVVISLGSNDGSGIDTMQALIEIRNRVKSKKVMWILPANSKPIQNIVRDVATQYNDLVIEIKSLSPDRVHPTMSGYKELAKEIRSH